INHKRRGPRLLRSFSESNATIDESEPIGLDHKIEGDADGENSEKVVGNGAHSDVGNGGIGEEEMKNGAVVEVEREVEFDDFLDSRDSMSTPGNTPSKEELDGSNWGERSWKASTPAGEYYDAFEEISSDGTRSSSRNVIEDELREMRFNLLMEIEKRKQAEEALENLRSQWQSLSKQLSLVGLTLPAFPDTDETGEQPNPNPAEELCRQIAIARAVAGSIGRACARAEVEMEKKPQIESKNFEITRLWDRLQYYETANREMSQRNQEAVEMARQQRQQKKRRQKWIWASVGLVVTLGAATLAWSYIPSSKPPHEAEFTASHRD
ncbi:uncharacterized protein LOC109839195, partial [Asparagus officinalis]